MMKQGLSGLVAEILYTNEEQAHLLPLDMERTGEGVIHWLERRVIPKNRTFVDDSFWVMPEGFEGKFSQYNLYENRFSEILTLVAYTGAGGSRQTFTTSPELTTGGMLPKAWRYVELDGIYLYKGGTTGASNAGWEPYCVSMQKPVPTPITSPSRMCAWKSWGPGKGAAQTHDRFPFQASRKPQPAGGTSGSH